MITGADFYHVMTAMVPLYVAMILAYASVKWWKIFTPDQCSGINRFVALFAVPFLAFHFISTNNPYTMNFRFLAADTLQKLMILAMLAIWANVSRRGSLEWTITLFSLSTLPNTLVMGVPLLEGMYGEFSGSLMVQIVVLQCIIWYTMLLFMLEFRGARMLIAEQFPDTAESIVSLKAESDVISLDGRESLQADAEVDEDGKLHVTVRRSMSSRLEIFSRRSLTPRASNLTNAEIYSLQSSRNPTPKESSFNHTDFHSMVGGHANVSPEHSNFGPTPRSPNYGEDSHHHHGHLPPRLPRTRFSAGSRHYPAPNTEIFSPKLNQASIQTPPIGQGGNTTNGMRRKSYESDKDLHMFAWSTGASLVSDGELHVFGGRQDSGNDQSVKIAVSPADDHRPSKAGDVKREMNWAEYGREERFNLGDSTTATVQGKDVAASANGQGKVCSNSASNAGDTKPTSMPPTGAMTRLILVMMWRKLIRNPNTYSSLLALAWSLISFRWNVQMPAIIEKSISLLSDAGLGMAMFSLGLFMALQPRMIACGNKVAALTMAVRFLAGPAVMAAASFAVGLRGVLLRVAIVQAALPEGIVPFVFAKEYNLHADILSTGVISGMLAALPVTLVYYILLQL